MDGSVSLSGSVLVDDIALSDLDDLPRPFDAIRQDLRRLGALSVEDYLTASTDADPLDVSFSLHDALDAQPEIHAGDDAEGADAQPLGGDAVGAASKVSNLRGTLNVLHQACQKLFGSANALTFDYVEEDPQRKQCILTITRPNGISRSYKSDASFARRNDAKAQAAAIAIEMGAIHFIITGDTDALKKKAALLNPADVDMDSADAGAGVLGETSRFVVDDEPVKRIVDCCNEWRAGLVQPHWVAFNDAKDRKKHGSALRIQLNTHVSRAYGIHPAYENPKVAKVACAKAAIDEGVLDFIKYGNGQTEPMKRDPENADATIAPPREKTTAKVLTLQQFFESLPRPLPEDVGDRTAQDINGPNWLNQAMQSAKGGRLTAEFIPVLDSIHHLHGCILRVERPEEVRTYFVDPHFPKRADARAAVCLLAMSQGFGDYCRQLKDEAAKRLPPERKKLAFEKVMQTLSSECGKVRPGNRLQFRFTTEREAFGCILSVDISPDADHPDVREYSVPPEYGAKTDAKAAVACLAAEQGLVDLVRFKGGPLPENYTPFWEAQTNGTGDNYVGKRKDTERDLDPESRHPKKVRRATRDITPPDPAMGRFKKNARPSGDHPQAPLKPPSGPSRYRELQTHEGSPREPAALRSKGHRRGASSMSYGQESTTSSAPPPPPYSHEHRPPYHHSTSYHSPPHPSSYPHPHPGAYTYHSPPPAPPMHFPSHPPPAPVAVAPVYPTYYPGPPPPAPMMYPYPYAYSAHGYPVTAPPPPAPYTSPYPPPAPVLYGSPPPLPPMAIPYAAPVMHSTVPYSPPYTSPRSPPGSSPHHYSMTYGGYESAPPASEGSGHWQTPEGGYYQHPQPAYPDGRYHPPPPPLPPSSVPPNHLNHARSPSGHHIEYGSPPAGVPHYPTQRPLPTGPAAMQGRSVSGGAGSSTKHQNAYPSGPASRKGGKGGQWGRGGPPAQHARQQPNPGAYHGSMR